MTTEGEFRTDDRLESLGNRITALETTEALTQTLLEKLVTRIEFKPIQLLVYGMVAMICSGVMAAIISRVVMK